MNVFVNVCNLVFQRMKNLHTLIIADVARSALVKNVAAVPNGVRYDSLQNSPPSIKRLIEYRHDVFLLFHALFG